MQEFKHNQDCLRFRELSAISRHWMGTTKNSALAGRTQLLRRKGWAGEG
jgi:hypothetical protein